MPKQLKIFVGFLAIVVIGLNFMFYPNNILSYDVFGYYLYLPTTFIYHDLGLENKDVIVNLIEQYNSTSSFYQINPTESGMYVMKYSMGLAVLYFPFFLLGWLGAIALDYPVDGFSEPFQFAIFTGGVIYTLLGLWFTAKVLNRFFNWKVSTISLGLVVFASNYLVHTSMYGQNAMSQNYLFTAYALVLWLTIKWNETYKLKYVVWLGLVMGVAILSRPTEIVMLAIPVLWQVYSKETLLAKLDTFWKHRLHVIIIALFLIFFGGMQLVYWKLYAGKFLYNSYGANPGEGLDLLNPHTWNFLFSFRKGWLIYSPIMVLAIAGFGIIYKKNKAVFWPLITYFVFNLYLVSSWSNWWYAQSFSQRAMVSSYPIMAIGLGYFIVWLMESKTLVRLIVSGVLTVLVLVNLFQIIQFDMGVLHADRMTKDYYFDVFGQLSVTEEQKKLLLVDRNFSDGEWIKNEEEYSKIELVKLDFDESSQATKSKSYSGCCSFELNENKPYSSIIEGLYQDLTVKDHAWIRVSANIFPTQQDIDENAFSLTITFNHNGYSYKYRALDANKMNLVPNEWNIVDLDYLTPEVRFITDDFRTMFWYRGNTVLYVDDFKVEVLEKN